MHSAVQRNNIDWPRDGEFTAVNFTTEIARAKIHFQVGARNNCRSGKCGSSENGGGGGESETHAEYRVRVGGRDIDLFFTWKRLRKRLGGRKAKNTRPSS